MEEPSDADRLEALLQEGAIDEVLGRLQSGKEASLYVVRRESEVIAAKVYKDRKHRSFKNAAVYAEGRKIRNSRDARALARRSAHGKATQEAAWKNAESENLVALHAAGVRVPTPIAIRDGIVLMELVTDANGDPAPRLIDTRPTPVEAAKLHEILLGEIEKMLAAGFVHGDLSAYNVLASARGPVIIDFPQTVSAAHNQAARQLLVRDVQNVTDFLAGFEPGLARHRGDGAALWSRYSQGEVADEGGAADPEDELARQIAEAKQMPYSIARSRGKKERRPEAPLPRRDERDREPRRGREGREDRRRAPEPQRPQGPPRDDRARGRPPRERRQDRQHSFARELEAQRAYAREQSRASDEALAGAGPSGAESPARADRRVDPRSCDGPEPRDERRREGAQRPSHGRQHDGRRPGRQHDGRQNGHQNGPQHGRQNGPQHGGRPHGQPQGGRPQGGRTRDGQPREAQPREERRPEERRPEERPRGARPGNDPKGRGVWDHLADRYGL